MLLHSKGKIRSGYILALLLLLVSFSFIFYSTNQFRKETNWMTHSYVIINRLEDLHTKTILAETSVRGYVLSRDSNTLSPYYSSLVTIPAAYRELKILTETDKEQGSKLDTLNRLIQERLHFFSYWIMLFKQAGQYMTAEIELKRLGNLVKRDSIQLYISKMINKEEEAMNVKKLDTSGFFQNTVSLIIISLVIAVIIIVYSIYTYNRENKAKQFADEKANQYRVKLENNIRQLKETNNELNELKSIEKFAATGRIARTIAHEVRNPLTNISLAADQLHEMTIQNNDSTMLIDMISRNAVRINQLVSDLLDATKFVQLNIQNWNINTLLDETLEMAKDRIELSHITVEKEYVSGVCDVAVDADKIKFAFLNIIVNAIEAMENNKGVLQVKTKKEAAKCIVEIKDNGKGMDEDTVQKVFEAYFTEKSKGTGLGLTNSQNIILSHEGSVKVYSQPSIGSSFIITLDAV